jgi:hypothetical protein
MPRYERTVSMVVMLTRDKVGVLALGACEERK